MLKNLTLKLVSVVAAVLLAYALQDASNSTVLTIFVPIEIRNPPADKMLVGRTKQGAQVTIKGPSFLVGEVAAAPPPLRLQLSKAVNGSYVAPLLSSDISLPHLVEVVRIDPPELELVFEAIEEREIKIEVPRLGQLAKGLNLTGVELTPKTVTVKGPRSELLQLRSVETQPLDLRDIKGSQSIALSLKSPGALSSLSIGVISAQVQVEELPSERQFAARPIEVRISANSKGIRLKPTGVSVTLAGAPQLLKDIDPIDVVPFIRLSNVPSRSGDMVEVSVALPFGVRLVKVSPASVAVWWAGSSKVPAAVVAETLAAEGRERK